MTTEDDFQAALDADPADWQTRLVFADWLEERGDVRAEGYRALGVLRKCPQRDHATGAWRWLGSGEQSDRHYLGADWHDALKRLGWGWCLDGSIGWAAVGDSMYHRRTADDEAAIAFSKLSPERRAELLGLLTEAHPCD